MERLKRYKRGYVNTVMGEILKAIEKPRAEPHIDLDHAFSDEVWEACRKDTEEEVRLNDLT